MRKAAVLLQFLILLAAVCVSGNAHADSSSGETAGSMSGPEGRYRVATFAGGCFWCMEPPFDRLEGVISTTSGYTGGHKADPSYEDVSAGGTGHAEAVRVVYDPERVTYAELLHVFWRNINPTTKDRQFVDVGEAYRPAVFYHDQAQKEQALRSRQAVQESGRFEDPVVTEIVPASRFYPAEDYHQDYYKKQPLKYKFYRFFSGRDQYLDSIWGEEDSETDSIHAARKTELH